MNEGVFLHEKINNLYLKIILSIINSNRFRDKMFYGKKIMLRGLELSDAEEIMKGFNNYEMRRFLGIALPYSFHEEQDWVKNTWKERRDGSAYNFALVKKDNSEFLGTISLMNVSKINKSAEYGIAIHKPENWSKGYGTEGLKIILSIGFDLLNLHTVMLRVFAFNPRGIKSYEKAGFKKSGITRDSEFRDGKYHDTIFMDILSSEYYELVAQSPDEWPRVGDQENRK
jgi:RimJ/RimL family protein N-acetyltransferase